MKFFKKIKLTDNIREVYFCGVKIYSYDKINFKKRYRNKLEGKIENFKISGAQNRDKDKKLIVSLTSFPLRMNYIHYTLYSLLNQSLKPDMVVLWLGEDKFLNKEKDLPESVLKLRKNGLSIKWCKDIKSYTKLVPSLREFPNDIIVTADDDIYYEASWLEKLYESYENSPQCIHCHRAHKIKFSENGDILPYGNWQSESRNSKATSLNFLTGVGGVLYPPKSLHADVLDEEKFMNLAPRADDIWFWAMAVLNGMEIKIIDKTIRQYLEVGTFVNMQGNVRLFDTNVLGGQNDIQLKGVMQHYPELENILKKELLSEK